MNTYTRSDLIADLANRQGVSVAQAQAMVEVTLGLISERIASGNDVSLRRFGTFSLRVTKPRVGRNPNNPSQPIPIPARCSVKFMPCREVKVAVESLDPEMIRP
jgi:nucleoid DNA-binding protein